MSRQVSDFQSLPTTYKSQWYNALDTDGARKQDLAVLDTHITD